MKKSIRTTLVAVVTLVAANLAAIETASAGKDHIRFRNTILGIGLLGLLHGSSHGHHQSSHNHSYYRNDYYDRGYQRPYYYAPHDHYYHDHYYYDDHGPYYYHY